MQQGSILEAGRPWSLPVSTPSRADTRSKAGGRTRSMWWNDSPTSICGTSHRWGETQSYQTQNLPVVHQQQLEQKQCATSMGGDGPRDWGLALVPHSSDDLPVICPAGNQLESALNVPSEEDRLVIFEMTT